MLDILLEVVAPVFLVAAAGWGFAAAHLKVNVRELTDVVIYLGAPCLIYSSMASGERITLDLDGLRVPIACTFVAFAGLGIGEVFLRLVSRGRSRHSLRGLRLPIAFINSGNLGLPLALLAFGEKGQYLAILYFITHSIWQYSIGILIAKGRGGWGEIVRLPLLWATVAGLIANQAQFTLPITLSIPIDLIGQTAVPLMLLSLGIQLRSIKMGQWKMALACAVLRILGGFGAALLVNWLMGNTGLTAKVCALAGSLPPAVMNFALAEKYRANEEVVSGAILIGTLLSVGTIPLVLWLIG